LFPSTSQKDLWEEEEEHQTPYYYFQVLGHPLTSSEEVVAYYLQKNYL
jgi:hypothetical protein